jgi:hypothetical protein
MALRGAPKAQPLGARRRTVTAIGRVDRAGGTNPVVGECRVEPVTCLRDKPSVALEERRKGAVVVGSRPPDARVPASPVSLWSAEMWIEEMFADFKGHGFDLESTQLRSFGRL